MGMTSHPLGREDERDTWGNLPGHSYCHIHNVDEPVPDEVYRVCFECGHVYDTAAELEARYIEEVQRMKKEHGEDGGWTNNLLAEQIYFCQECLHDF